MLARLKLRHDGANQASRDPVLQLERRLAATVVAIGPQQGLGESIRQLRADTDMVALPAERAVQDITDAPFGGNASRIGSLRCWNDAARDHGELPEANERRLLNPGIGEASIDSLVEHPDARRGRVLRGCNP